jgi:hypothetical protein
VSDLGFALASAIGGAFGIVSLLILDRNWFRRERFKLERDTLRAENNIRMKKMAKDLGVDKKGGSPISANSPTSSSFDTLKSLAPLLQKLAPEDVQDLLGLVTGQETSESGDLGSMIAEFASKNPALVEGFLSKFANKEGQDATAAQDIKFL